MGELLASRFCQIERENGSVGKFKSGIVLLDDDCFVKLDINISHGWPQLQPVAINYSTE